MQYSLTTSFIKVIHHPQENSGHMITHAGGKQCTCGGEGCYECYASAKALIEAVNKANSTNLNAFQIF